MNDPTVLSRGRFSLVLFGLLGSVILADAIHVEDRTQMEGGATDSALGAGMSSARPCEQMDPQLRDRKSVV